MAYSADQILDDVRSWAKIYLDNGKAFTRDCYRSDSAIPEYEWKMAFGTWAELKRQAGVTETRGLNKFFLDVARHASRDVLDGFNKERMGYGSKYGHGRQGRFRTVLVGSDFHDKESDPFVVRTFLDAAKRIKPDVVFLNGDMIDLPEFGRYTNDPRSWDLMGRLTWLHGFLSDVRKAAPNAAILYLEGNHETRLLRHLAESTPQMRELLSDLHGFTVGKLLGLDEYQVEYIGKADLRAWSNKDITKELHKNNYVLWDMLLGDHFPTGLKQGIPGWNGHHHKLVITPMYTRTYGASCWVQLPGGHVANAEYCEGEKWNNGFLIVHADTLTKRAVFEPIEVRDFCVIGGQYYWRTKEETWYKDQPYFKT